jgi:hypothetical protein
MRILALNIYMYMRAGDIKKPPLEKYNNRKHYYTSNKGNYLSLEVLELKIKYTRIEKESYDLE